MDKGIIQGKSHFINHVSSQHSGSEVEITQEVRKIRASKTREPMSRSTMKPRVLTLVLDPNL